jgi:hypothetical protein
VQLHSTTSNRDAIGARLVVTAGGRTQSLFACGGDGIACSNERTQIIGLGPAERIERLEVRWPSGKTSEYDDLPTGQTIVVVEGHTGKSLKYFATAR